MTASQTIERPNIVWLVPDGIRAIPCNDSLGRLSFMDTFKRDSVEYTRMYTTAPSTAMSFYSIFTGLPSVFFSDTYGFIKNHLVGVPTIYHLLKQLGYNMYFFTFEHGVRELHDVFRETDCYFGSCTEFDEAYFHSCYGSETKQIVEQFLSRHMLKAPFCFFYHAFFTGGIRRPDYDFSADIEHIYELLYDRIADGDTIELLHSDHGYPIYKPTVDKEAMWSHDLVMTEDNIRVPFFLKYPGCKRDSEIDTPCSLLDIYPTLCDLLNVEPDSPFLCGTSVLPESRNFARPRFIRSDNRFGQQSNRITAIIRGSHKLLHYHDENVGKLYQVGPALAESELTGNMSTLNRELTEDMKNSDSHGQSLRKQIICTIVDNATRHFEQLLLDYDSKYALLAYCSDQTASAFSSIVSPQVQPLLTIGIPEDNKYSSLAVADRLHGIDITLIVLLVDSITNMDIDSFQLPIDFMKNNDLALLVVDRWYSMESVADFDGFITRKRAAFQYRQLRSARHQSDRKHQKQDSIAMLDGGRSRKT